MWSDKVRETALRSLDKNATAVMAKEGISFDKEDCPFVQRTLHKNMVYTVLKVSVPC